MTRKYDRPALKLEFFQSDIDDIAPFIEKRLGKSTAKNGTIAKNTKGRDKEKEAYKEKVLERALMANANKQAKGLEIPMEQLSIAKKNAVIKVINAMMKDDMDITDLERTIKIIRTEMGLPTTYSKSENLNTEKIEGIHIIMGGNVERQE